MRSLMRWLADGRMALGRGSSPENLYPAGCFSPTTATQKKQQGKKINGKISLDKTSQCLKEGGNESNTCFSQHNNTGQNKRENIPGSNNISPSMSKMGVAVACLFSFWFVKTTAQIFFSSDVPFAGAMPSHLPPQQQWVGGWNRLIFCAKFEIHLRKSFS